MSSLSPQVRPLHVNGHPTRLVQCPGDILMNSIKYTDPKGRIRIQTREENQEIVLTVSDNGAGISAELGIGLAVVKRLVEMHKGRVCTMSPGVGQGATFELRLPLIERVDIEAESVRGASVRTRRVLIVDDNVDSASSLAMLLKLEGHETLASHSGADAIEQTLSFRPDVVLLDIGLPGMDGYEVARRMRRLPGFARVRLVALTGYAQSADRLHALAAGFDDHLVKPVELLELERTLSVQH
jgi:CheY-like chemotaxis protein